MTCLKCRLVTLVWEWSFGKHCRNYKKTFSKRCSAVTHILSWVCGPKAFCKNNQGKQVLQWPSQRNSIECADKLKKNWMENIIKDEQEGSCSRASWVCLPLVLLKGHITSVVITIQLTRFRFKCSEITTAHFYCIVLQSIQDCLNPLVDKLSLQVNADVQIVMNTTDL